MARIDHSNYEAWLLDRLEGRLTADEERVLEAFLLAHPELRPDDEPLPAIGEELMRLSANEKERLRRVLPPVGAVRGDTLHDHLVARIEGDLSAEQERALTVFLQAHPEHAREARLYELAQVKREPVPYTERAGLLRELPPVGVVDARSLNDHLVARLEGDLSAGQEEALSLYLSVNPAAQREWRLMQATRMGAASVAYADKAALKRGGRVVPLFPAMGAMRWAAAASVALLLAAAWWMNRPGPNPVADRQSTPSAIEGTTVEREPGPGAAQQALAEPQESDSPAVGSPRAPRVRESQAEPSRPIDPPRSNDAVLPQAPPEEPMMAQEQQPATPSAGSELPVVPAPSESVARASAPAATVSGAGDRSLGQALAGVLRERVLERPAEEQRPLDADDAVAAIDRGLRAVGGERAGLAVKRDAQGRGNGFALRLGRNLAITASR